MKRIRCGLIVLLVLLCSITAAVAQVDINIELPGESIGINLPLFPELVPVRGYPVYYAPELEANYFFYDGMYWVYQNDNWYASSWYNGPWGLVDPAFVPLFVLRVPVRYYRQPPVYFQQWRSDASPRWGQHWGHDWEQHRRGWDRWKRSSAPAPAPLPVYQRHYSGDRYPHPEQQHSLRTQNYQYQPRTKIVRQHFKQQAVQKAPAAVQKVPVPVKNAPVPVQKVQAPIIKAPVAVKIAPAPVQKALIPVQKAPAAIKKAPVPAQRAPALIKKVPPPVQKAPVPLQRAPVTVQKAPVPIKRAPVPVQKAPVPVKKTPAPVQKAPAAVQKAPAPIQKAPVPIKKAPVPVQKAPVPVKAPAAVKKAPEPVPKAPAPAQ